MALFCDCSESRFRQNFRKKFDWVRYNLAFCREKLRHRIAIAIDPSYIPKSGIEYLYRDAKQFAGLTHCQSWKRESLDFAFNMSLSSINVARFFSRSCGMHLSVSNVKTLIHNADMIQRFIRMSGKRPHRLLNTNDFKELLFYGVSDAA